MYCDYVFPTNRIYDSREKVFDQPNREVFFSITKPLGLDFSETFSSLIGALLSFPDKNVFNLLRVSLDRSNLHLSKVAGDLTWHTILGNCGI